MLRKLLLSLAGKPAFLRWMSRLGDRLGLVRRFVAGETVEEAIQVARRLNCEGLAVTLDLLGEGVQDVAQAEKATEAYIHLVNRIHQSGIRSGISIKLTHLGLAVSKESCRANLTRLVIEAARLKRFVRIDMEESRYTQDTLDLFLEHVERFGSFLGIVIQAYLYRSEGDVRRLSALGCNVRLCKGAYMEPPEVAFSRKKEVDENFIRLLRILLESRSYTAIATHDPKMIAWTRRFVAAQEIEPSRYEFQMLYGVRRDLQLQLRQAGYKVRVYVPFGTFWAPYFLRRMAERPANLVFVLKQLVRR